ncbi:MAG: nuclear transport factor 2 family protein [Acidimicrobiales bacterium]
MDRDTALQQLSDDAEIRRVLYRYARGIDRRDPELVRSCYHADAIDHHGTFDGTRDEYVMWVFQVLEAHTFTSHNLMNISIEVCGDLALVETYAVATHGGEPATDRRKNFVAGFRYVDRFERRDGGWRIAERQVVNDWAEAWAPDRSRLGRFGVLSRSGPDDPLYALARTVPGAVEHSDAGPSGPVA